jgi:hypothetical protein
MPRARLARTSATAADNAEATEISRKRLKALASFGARHSRLGAAFLLNSARLSAAPTDRRQQEVGRWKLRQTVNSMSAA